MGLEVELGEVRDGGEGREMALEMWRWGRRRSTMWMVEAVEL